MYNSRNDSAHKTPHNDQSLVNAKADEPFNVVPDLVGT
jgi:hypothetical protein